MLTLVTEHVNVSGEIQPLDWRVLGNGDPSDVSARLQQVATGGGGVTEAVRQIIEAAEARKRYIAGYYREQVRLNPVMRAVFDREAPGWAEW